MATIQEQLALEQKMVSDGAARYRAMLKASEDAGRGSETNYALKQMQSMIEPMSWHLEEKCEMGGASRNGKSVGLLRGTDYTACCFIALQMFFNECHGGSEASLTSLCGKIGQRIEDDLKFKKFREEHTDYVDAIIADFKRKGTNSYRHKHRVMTKMANDRDLSWNAWTEKERVGVGLLIMNSFMLTSDAATTFNRWKKGKTHKVIRMSEALVAWIADNTKFMETLYPYVGPCIIEPDPWTGLKQGGFYLPQMRKRFPLVKTRAKAHRDLLEASDLSPVLSAINRAQATQWRVNRRVLDVMHVVWEQNLKTGMPASSPIVPPPFPDCIPEKTKQAEMTEEQLNEFLPWKIAAAKAHGDEKERVSKLQMVSRSLQTAERLKDHESIWFVYQCDFRGRIYPMSPGFSPQGADQAKGLLQFSKGEPLGRNGLYHLKVHAANKYGYDKDTYAGRVAFIDNIMGDITAIGRDPLGTRELWGCADKPYQYLAAAIEIAEANGLPDPTVYASHIPVARDGSCNGLQNFSAMLHDDIGGAAVNLVPTHIPADIYGAVATVLGAKLERSTNPMAERWLSFGVNRSLCKKPVMTLPYGSTRRTCTESILRYVYDTNTKNGHDYFGKETWQAAQFITPLLWDSIGEVVIAAREAMKWLQQCSRILAKDNIPFVWKAPNGFVVYQAAVKYDIQFIQTLLLGFLKRKLRVSVRIPTTVLDPRRQASGSAPNFVHSMDAAHMMGVINNCGLDSLAMIHDDFGCHACYIDDFDKTIREEFVKLYDGKDILASMKAQFQRQSKRKFPEPPKHGTLDIKGVLDSAYFFG